MKKIVLSLMMAAAMTGCDDSTSQPAQQASTPAPVSAKPTTLTTPTVSTGHPSEQGKSHIVGAGLYSARPTENSWPSVSGEGQVLASNLLTKNYYVVLDGSGSMDSYGCSGEDTKMDAAKKAVKIFASQIPQASNVGLFVFDNNGTYERVKLGANTLKAVNKAVDQTYAGGGTPLETSIRAGYRALESQARSQLGYGEYHLVVVTDGEANIGEDPGKMVDDILKGSPVELHTIGFCIGGGHSLNRPGHVDYKQANDPESLTKGLTEVLAEAPDFTQGSFEG